MVTINRDTTIPESELTFSTARSSGPGGQNVNKVSTKVVLHFDIENSSALTDEQKGLLTIRLQNRVSKSGILTLACQSTRSQFDNKKEVVDRFSKLISAALRKQPPRKKTRVPAGAVKKRIKSKTIHGRKKSERSKISIEKALSE
jgi:ribosome-associated protein